MKKYKGHESINTWSVLALRNLTLNNIAAVEKISNLGGFRVILGAMHEFNDELKLQGHGLSALVNMTSVSSEAALENAEMMVASHGVELIVRALCMFRSIASIQLCGCALLCTISSMDKQRAKTVLACGGKEAVLSSMIAFRSTLALQRNGITLMCMLAQIGPNARSKIVKAHGIEAISAALKAHIADETLIERGMSTRRLLTGKEINRETPRSFRGVETDASEY
jgi:hypothetical protein